MAPFKSTQSFSVGTFLRTFRNRDAVGPAALNSPVRSNREPPFSASGGTKTTYGSYTVHSFLTPGSFVVENAPDSLTCDILVVGGGGAGGSGKAGAYEAGGGGAGGMRAFPNQPVGDGTFTVTVGSGGVADQVTLAPNFGGYSELATPSPLRSEGGGVGGMNIMAGLSYGGSSGGGRRSSTSDDNNNHVAGPPSPTPSSVPAQGNYGGTGYSSGGNSGGGGGGGAGGQGGDAGSNAGGAGGLGLENNYRTGSNVFYAGGGGGTGFSSGGASGGSSIGGDGGNSGTAGATNTGSGGGAGDHDGPTNNGGNGGSGIIVVRYLTSP